MILVNYLESNNLLHNHHYGLWSGRNNEVCVNKLYSQVLDHFHKGNYTIAIFLYLSRSFEMFGLVNFNIQVEILWN